MATRNGKKQITLWVTQREKDYIKKMAEEAGLTVTDFIRRSAFGKKIQSMGDTELMREYAAQLGKVGSNLNQIARRLNGGEMSYGLLEETKDGIADFVDLKFRIMMALEEMCAGKGHKG